MIEGIVRFVFADTMAKEYNRGYGDGRAHEREAQRHVPDYLRGFAEGQAVGHERGFTEGYDAGMSLLVTCVPCYNITTEPVSKENAQG